MLWGDAKSDHIGDASEPKRRTVTEFFRATAGSEGLDLSSSTYTVLTPEMGMQALPTGIFWPSSEEHYGPLIGEKQYYNERFISSPWSHRL